MYSHCGDLPSQSAVCDEEEEDCKKLTDGCTNEVSVWQSSRCSVYGRGTREAPPFTMPNDSSRVQQTGYALEHFY